MIYSSQESKWYEGRVRESKIEIHPASALVPIDSNLYCQDPEGRILCVHIDDDMDPVASRNLHTKELDPLESAWTGTPMAGESESYSTEAGYRSGVALYYLSSSGDLVRGIDVSFRRKEDENMPDVENPCVSAWREYPWSHANPPATLPPDFAMVPHPSRRATPTIVFRTAGDVLNVCWQSEENAARWAFLPRVCQTAPGSRFQLHFPCRHSDAETMYVFFISTDARLEIIEIDYHMSEDRPCISRRAVVDESCGAKPWDRLIMTRDIGSSVSDMTEADMSSYNNNSI